MPDLMLVFIMTTQICTLNGTQDGGLCLRNTELRTGYLTEQSRFVMQQNPLGPKNFCCEMIGCAV
jgi:hypothetical protein